MTEHIIRDGDTVRFLSDVAIPAKDIMALFADSDTVKALDTAEPKPEPKPAPAPDPVQSSVPKPAPKPARSPMHQPPPKPAPKPAAAPIREVTPAPRVEGGEPVRAAPAAAAKRATGVRDNEAGQVHPKGEYSGFPKKFRKEYLVRSYEDFRQAHSVVQPGEAIVVKDGSHRWTKDVPRSDRYRKLGDRPVAVKKSGTAGLPVYIVAQTPFKAHFDGSGITWGLEGSHIVMGGFDCENSRGIYVLGPDNRVTNNTFSKRSGYIVVAHSGANRLEMDNNEFNGGRGIAVVCWRGNELTSACKSNSRGGHMHHNTWRNKPFIKGANAHEAIILGLGYAPLPGEKTYNADGPNLDWLIENNLFDGWNAEDELVSVKSSGNIIRFNAVLNAPNTDIVIRAGYDNLIYANWIEGGGKGLRIAGMRNVFAFNYYNRKGAAMIRLHAGTNNKKGKSSWSAAKKSLAARSWEYINAEDNVIERNVFNGMSRVVDLMKGSSTIIAMPEDNRIRGNALYGSSLSGKGYKDYTGKYPEAEFRENNAWGDNAMIAGALPPSACFNPDLFDGPGGPDACIEVGSNITGGGRKIMAPSWW